MREREREREICHLCYCSMLGLANMCYYLILGWTDMWLGAQDLGQGVQKYFFEIN